MVHKRDDWMFTPLLDRCLPKTLSQYWQLPVKKIVNHKKGNTCVAYLNVYIVYYLAAYFITCSQAEGWRDVERRRG